MIILTKKGWCDFEGTKKNVDDGIDDDDEEEDDDEDGRICFRKKKDDGSCSILLKWKENEIMLCALLVSLSVLLCRYYYSPDWVSYVSFLMYLQCKLQ